MQDHEQREPTAAGRAWTARSLGSAFQHQVFYAIIRFGGRRLAYFALWFVVGWYVLFRPVARRRSSFYLDRRFPGRNPFQRGCDCFRLCLGLGRVLVDRAVLGILGPGTLNSSPSGWEDLRAQLAEGRGLILVTAHVGSWQLGMASLALLQCPVSLLIHREEGDVDRHFFEHGDQGAPFRIIDPLGYLGGTLEMLQVLKQGEVLCIMGDRVMGGAASNVAVDFLGAPVAMPISPYKLASATGAPIAVIFPHPDGPDRYVLRLDRTIHVPGSLGRAASAYRPYARQYAEALEQFVQDHPFQFFNFFDMWTETPVKPDN